MLITDNILRDVQNSLLYTKDEFVNCSVVHPEYVQALKINEESVEEYIPCACHFKLRARAEIERNTFKSPVNAM